MSKNVARQNAPTIVPPVDPATVVAAGDPLLTGDQPNISRNELFKSIVRDSIRSTFFGGTLPVLFNLVIHLFYAVSSVISYLIYGDHLEYVVYSIITRYINDIVQYAAIVVSVGFLSALIGGLFGVILAAITCWVFYPLRNPTWYRVWVSLVPLLMFVFIVPSFAVSDSLFTGVLCMLALLYALWVAQRIAVRSIIKAGLTRDPRYRPAPRVLDSYLPESRQALFDMAPEIADRMEWLAGLGLLARWRGALLGRLDLRPGMRAVDLMAGTGSVSRALVRRVGAGHVTAVEFAPGVAARLWGVEGVDVLEADALASGLPSGGADVVTCAFGTLGLRQVDQIRLADEVDRLLAPNGVVGVVDLTLPRNPGLRWAYLVYLQYGVPAVARLFLEHPALYHQLQRYVRESVGLGLLAYEFESRGYTVALTPLEGGLATALVVMKQGVEE